MSDMIFPMFDRRHLATLLAVWIFAGFYLLPFLDRGWIPSDEGLLAHSAERVLQGELPHRDFGDMYTGGQAFLHALALRLFGIELGALRLLLYLATLLAVPLIYHLAARHARPWLAGAITLTCLVWTVPNYFASMPSWYNLFLALGVLAALRAQIESGRRACLVLAGVLTGASFLIKSSALLVLAAVFLFFVYREMEMDGAEQDEFPENQESSNNHRKTAWPLFTTCGVGLFLTALVFFISKMPAPAEFLVFVGPSACLSGLLIAETWRRPGCAFGRRFLRLMGLTLPYLGGVLLPCLLFLLPYFLRGDAATLLSGEYLFVAKRLDFTIYALPRAETAIFALPMLFLLLIPVRRSFSPIWERRLLLPTALFLVCILALGPMKEIYQSVWFSFRPLPTAIALAGTLLLFFRGDRLTSTGRQSLFLTLSLMAVVSVTQFPFARGIYFCYIAPLVILALLELIHRQEGAPRRLHAVFLAFYTLFGAFWLNLGWIEAHGLFFYSKDLGSRLELSRAELSVSEEESRNYARAIELVRSHSDPGEFIYAAPDCPEIYFLADRRNPTPSFYDYFEDDFRQPRRTERLLQMLEEFDIRAVVLHHRANFSGPPDPAFEQGVRMRFPHRETVRPRFTVYWRDAPQSEQSATSAD